MIWLPDHGIGAVILTNADSGVIIRGPLLRRLLEVAFDGKPEAEDMLNLLQPLERFLVECAGRCDE